MRYWPRGNPFQMSLDYDNTGLPDIITLLDSVTDRKTNGLRNFKGNWKKVPGLCRSMQICENWILYTKEVSSASHGVILIRHFERWGQISLSCANHVLIQPERANAYGSLAQQIISTIRWSYSLEFSVGVCRPVLQILTLFQTKTSHFPHPFSDLASKIHTRFQTCRSQELVKFTRIFSSNDIFWKLFFSTIHLELKRQIRLYALVVPLKTIPNLRP